MKPFDINMGMRVAIYGVLLDVSMIRRFDGRRGSFLIRPGRSPGRDFS